MGCKFWEGVGHWNYFAIFSWECLPSPVFPPGLSTHVFPNTKAVWEENFCRNSTLREAKRSRLVTFHKFGNCWFYEVRLIILKFVNESFLTLSIFIVSRGQNNLRKMIKCNSKGWVKGIHSSRYFITLKKLLEKSFKSCDLSELGLKYIIQITTCISEKMQFWNFVYSKFLLGLIY